VSTIVIGVDATERSEDAIAFGRQIAGAAGALVAVASAFPYPSVPNRAADVEYRRVPAEDATTTAQAMRDRLEGIPEDRSAIRVAASVSPPAHALHDVATAEHASLVIVGSTHAAHCPVIVVPRGIEAPLGGLFDGATETVA
jgi:nucleotide-binding universal stress UspA family protein